MTLSRVLIIEKEFCGTGPLGAMVDGAKERWQGGTEKYAKRSTMGEALRLERTMFKQLMRYNVFLTLKTLTVISIKGFVSVARNFPQAQRQRSAVELARKRGTVKKLSESLMQMKLELM